MPIPIPGSIHAGDESAVVRVVIAGIEDQIFIIEA